MPFFHAYIKAISWKKHDLPPFNSCVCFSAKTAVRASSGLCLECVQSTEYVAKSLLVISIKGSSHWFWLLNLFHFGLRGNAWKRHYRTNTMDIKYVRRCISDLNKGNHPQINPALKSIKKIVVLFSTSSLKRSMTTWTVSKISRFGNVHKSDFC